MSYATDTASTLATQLAKFVTLNRYQLAGQAANLDFWVGEVRHALDVIDGYAGRFERMTKAQQAYVAEHEVRAVRFYLDHDDRRSAPKPRRVPHEALVEARRALCDSTYRFLIHTSREGMIEESALRDFADRLGLGIEARDLKSAF